ncbi:hypothetical protein QQ045_014567 [Rhodiola kirilowii]
MVERWRSETHTFHLRHGEMTITLEDVGVLTVLSIEGRAMNTNQVVDDELCMQLLGVVLPQGRRDSSVRCTWFRENMSEVPADATDESTHTQLSGCAILVQLWAWEHLIIGRPRKLDVPSPPTSSDVDPMWLPALGYKWSVPKSWMQTSHYVLMLYRDLLDRQESNDVIWTPYNDEVLATHNPMCVAGRESWRVKVPLICFNIAEWHYPSRALRHFGWIQPEPPLPPQTHKDMHMSKRRTSELTHEQMQVYMTLWDNRADNVVTGEPDTDGTYLDAYYTWYYNVTRKRIQPPVDTPKPYHPSGFQINLLVTSLVRTCKVTSALFLKTSDIDSKRALHDLFHSTRAELLRIGEGLALDVDPADIRLDNGV